MADTIPDLWGDEIGIEILSPVVILNTQAANIQRRTQGVIVAELLTRISKHVNELNFDIKTRDSKYRTRLLVCRSAMDEVYPVWISSKAFHPITPRSPLLVALTDPRNLIPDWLSLTPEESTVTRVAFDQESFFEVVRQVLSSDYVKGKINSIIARSNETSQRLEHVIPDEYYQSPIAE